MLHFSLSGVRSLTNPLRGTFQAHKICYKVKLNEEISNIKSFFGSLGYPLEVIEKTINKTTAKLVSPTKHGPIKCPVYLRLPYFGKEAKLFEN